MMIIDFIYLNVRRFFEVVFTQEMIMKYSNKKYVFRTNIFQLILSAIQANKNCRLRIFYKS